MLQYYIDPLSGYEFRSKVDALRYLETGDINNCAIRPKKKGINGTKSVPEDNSVSVLLLAAQLIIIRYTSVSPITSFCVVKRPIIVKTGYAPSVC